MSFETLLQEDRRLAVLRLLVEAGGSANESVLHAGLRALGNRIGREDTRRIVEWLKERRLVEISFFKETILVAGLTERGLDVANGDATVDGVKRPSPV
ncbi:VpaChn25_0724 family phage protein [Azospirillum sp. A39]|uniref:VpaChn25_0724 family phage protein n=1 Tax=Azospirillum sp. A39 TaxID=3462279 RepID=UPI004045F7BA